MKATIFTAVLLMLTLATFAQTSRRGDQERKKDVQTNESNKRTYQKPNNQTQEATRTVNPSRRPQQNQPVVNRENRGNDNKNTGVTRRVDNNRGNDNKNYGNNDSRRGDNNNYRGNETRRGDHYKPDNRNDHNNTRVIVKNGQRREYVHIVRPQRKVVVVHNRPGYHPRPIEYRRVHYPYREPRHNHVIWSVHLHNDFRIFYPEVRVWRYNIGYQLPVIPAYDAEMYIGDVARVYGKVEEVFYDYDSDNYFLYIGDYYPYHDFSIIIPGIEARRFSRRPERYFENSHIAVTGYITENDNKPEIVIRRASQLDLY